MTDSIQPWFSRRTLLVLVVMVVAFIAVLWWFQRPLVCKTGFGIWTSAYSDCTSQHLFDPYTFSHVLHGVIFFWLLWPFSNRIALAWRLVIGVGLEIGWELIENSPVIIEHYRNNTASFNYSGDSVVNSLMDVLATVLGFAFTSRFSWKMSVFLFVALELLALYLSRDGLTLNILMFLFPLEGVKAWQLRGA
jgi:hypothetical protein